MAEAAPNAGPTVELFLPSGKAIYRRPVDAAEMLPSGGVRIRSGDLMKLGRPTLKHELPEGVILADDAKVSALEGAQDERVRIGKPPVIAPPGDTGQPEAPAREQPVAQPTGQVSSKPATEGVRSGPPAVDPGDNPSSRKVGGTAQRTTTRAANDDDL